MDIQILLAIQSFRESVGGFLSSFMSFLSTVAVDYYLFVPALILFWAVDKKKGLTALGSFGSALFIGSALKASFCVYRPWVKAPEIVPPESVKAGASSYSFPSGHSFSVASFYFGLSAADRKNKGLFRFAVVMVLLTMFSRLYFGVHTPQDVLVGLLIGLVAVTLVCRVLAWVEEHPEKDWVVLLIVVALCAALLPYLQFKSYPMDYVDGKLLVDPRKMTVDGFKDPGRFFGVVVGWFIERRFIRFDIAGTREQKLTRCLFGALLFIFYWTAVIDPLGKAIGVGYAHFFLQASAPALFMTVYPLVFKRIEAKS